MTKSSASIWEGLFGWEDQSLEVPSPLTAYKQKVDFNLAAKISRGLDDCATHHAKSCRISNEAPPPSRLLDVGSTSGEVRLVETKLLQTPLQKYNCLSHCWGAQQPLQCYDPIM